jgi:tetratricopeptide (TPR) repeat protein
MYHILLTIFLIQATYIDLYQEGQMLLDKGDIKGAEAVLTKAVFLNQGHVPTLKALAEVYAKSKRFPEAINQYQRIIQLNPSDSEARGRVAELYSWVGNNDKAIVTYKEAIELDKNNHHLKTGLAKVLRWSRRYDEAEQFYNEALKDNPDDHEALKGLAKTYARTGDLSSAGSILDKAIRLSPNDAELYKEKGNVLAWQKDFHGAMDALQRGLSLSQNNPDIYRTMGDVYFWMKDYQKSIESYKKAEAIEPDNIENHIMLAKVYKAMGKEVLSEEQIKIALKINPLNEEANHLLADIKGSAKYFLVKKTGEIIELLVHLFVFVLVVYAYKRKRQILRRRHKAYTYFVNFALPSFTVITFAIHFSGTALSRWLDVELLHSLSENLLLFALGVSFLTLLWVEQKSKEFKEAVVLAIGAHPDDIELGCGGFIMKAKDSGAKVYGLTLTKGENGDSGNGNRKIEAEKTARFMEMDGFWVMDFKDAGLKEDIPIIKNAIENKIKETGATIILTHTAIDIHGDHQAAFEATKEAARNAATILCYEDVSTPREFVPNYYADVTEYIDDKLKLITFHKTQQDKTYMDTSVLKGRAAHRGLQSGVAYAEAFRIHKIVK